MVVEGEAVGGVESGGGVSQRRFGGGWLGWVRGWVLQGERKKEVMYGRLEGVLVQEMGCKKVVEVGRGSRGIYRAYRCIYYRGLVGYIIYSRYIVYRWGD